MANSLLSPTAVTREALRVLHQKLNFVGSITREYDDSFARQGAKVGDTLKVRLPNQYVVRTGPTLDAQDTTETSVELKVQTQKGVDLNFTSVDLTLSLDDFSERIIEPAMSVLAANIEADAMGMYKDVYNQVNNQGAAASFAKILQGRKIQVDNLAPLAGRTCNLNTQDNVDLVDALKGLFNDKASISKQYREGFMGRSAGFDFMENTLWPSHTVGTKAGSPLVNGAGQTGGTLATDGWSNSSAILKAGDVFTITGVFRVHPETKQSTGVQQQFVVRADASSNGSGVASLQISPAIITTGAAQNVSNAPGDNMQIQVAGTGAAAHGISMAYHKGAFAFATADMVMPRGVDFAAREVFDGVSMRIVRQYDINNDKFPCRLDVLYGFQTLRPQLACRLANN
ncbi:MAG: P22 phage major capsid protein family protein [Phenylobacterium sp.]|uniref:P22 phage major capsid protein family protein n=1 Tax=Phenylobacterium sp. TaxID=1871053 RepID=UPI00271EBAB1|nr:P22 phage major capsid protein family protein [Phenylobacterium sp.]MDO8408890.1 P22 phage major capsid protein family protein [Phenylobacterium sp.]